MFGWLFGNQINRYYAYYEPFTLKCTSAFLDRLEIYHGLGGKLAVIYGNMSASYRHVARHIIVSDFIQYIRQNSRMIWYQFTIMLMSIWFLLSLGDTRCWRHGTENGQINLFCDHKTDHKTTIKWMGI